MNGVVDNIRTAVRSTKLPAPVTAACPIPTQMINLTAVQTKVDPFGYNQQVSIDDGNCDLCAALNCGSKRHNTFCRWNEGGFYGGESGARVAAPLLITTTVTTVMGIVMMIPLLLLRAHQRQRQENAIVTIHVI